MTFSPAKSCRTRRAAGITARLRRDGRSRASAGAGPAGAPLRYRGTGVLMSRASHRRRPITPVTTVGAGAGRRAHHGLARSGGPVRWTSAPAPRPVPDTLAVVQVQTGESLQQLAQRVAPDAPVGPVVDQIRELNELDSAASDAGQTLIAPVG